MKNKSVKEWWKRIKFRNEKGKLRLWVWGGIIGALYGAPIIYGLSLALFVQMAYLVYLDFIEPFFFALITFTEGVLGIELVGGTRLGGIVFSVISTIFYAIVGASLFSGISNLINFFKKNKLSFLKRFFKITVSLLVFLLILVTSASFPFVGKHFTGSLSGFATPLFFFFKYFIGLLILTSLCYVYYWYKSKH